ncbi:large ribosomal subunit protein bL35m [Stigmatopora nigra]
MALCIDVISKENMAAYLARKLTGLLKSPLPFTLYGRTANIARLSGFFRAVHPFSVPTARCTQSYLPATACRLPGFSLLQRVSALIPPLSQQPNRSLTYYSIKLGKRKSVKSVTERFMRLHCGLWIRRKAGYKKKLWKKKPARRRRLREHVFCNKTQSKLLDKMTTRFWKRRNWYVDDPYLKYHDRVNLKV